MCVQLEKQLTVNGQVLSLTETYSNDYALFVTNNTCYSIFCNKNNVCYNYSKHENMWTKLDYTQQITHMEYVRDIIGKISYTQIEYEDYKLTKVSGRSTMAAIVGSISTKTILGLGKTCHANYHKLSSSLSFTSLTLEDEEIISDSTLKINFEGNITEIKTNIIDINTTADFPFNSIMHNLPK
jgi:hypothetical protein